MRRRLYINSIDSSDKHTLWVNFVLTDESILNNYTITFTTRNNTKIYCYTNSGDEQEISMGKNYTLESLFNYPNYTVFKIYMEYNSSIELDVSVWDDNAPGVSEPFSHASFYTQTGSYDGQNRSYDVTIKSTEGIVIYNK